MITRNSTNPLSWDASPSMLPELLPFFVEYVAEHGGKYINTKDRVISVDDVMVAKKRMDCSALEARMHYSLLEGASDLAEKSHHQMNMRLKAYGAGVDFLHYVMALGRSLNPEVTPLITGNPILKAFFDEGFSDEDRYVHCPHDDID